MDLESAGVCTPAHADSAVMNRDAYPFRSDDSATIDQSRAKANVRMVCPVFGAQSRGGIGHCWPLSLRFIVGG